MMINIDGIDIGSIWEKTDFDAYGNQENQVVITKITKTLMDDIPRVWYKYLTGSKCGKEKWVRIKMFSQRFIPVNLIDNTPLFEDFDL